VPGGSIPSDRHAPPGPARTSAGKDTRCSRCFASWPGSC
jgi:hypothetical protein